MRYLVRDPEATVLFRQYRLQGYFEAAIVARSYSCQAVDPNS
jgi:hypothetical protein